MLSLKFLPKILKNQKALACDIGAKIGTEIRPIMCNFLEGEATVSKCIPGVKLPKYTYTLIHFDTPGKYFERNSYFTPTRL